MKRSLLYATSILAVAVFSAPSLAESPAKSENPDSTGQTQISPGAQLNTDPGTGTDAGTTASTASDMDSFVTILGTGSDAARTIGTMKQVSSVTVVNTSDLAKANKQAYDAALNNNVKPITDLQAAVAANEAFSTELVKSKVQATDVVATKVNADGSVTVYVQ